MRSGNETSVVLGERGRENPPPAMHCQQTWTCIGHLGFVAQCSATELQWQPDNHQPLTILYCKWRMGHFSYSLRLVRQMATLSECVATVLWCEKSFICSILWNRQQPCATNGLYNLIGWMKACNFIGWQHVISLVNCFVVCACIVLPLASSAVLYRHWPQTSYIYMYSFIF